jgi:hypothetical protein
VASINIINALDGLFARPQEVFRAGAFSVSIESKRGSRFLIDAFS